MKSEIQEINQKKKSIDLNSLQPYIDGSIMNFLKLDLDDSEKNIFYYIQKKDLEQVRNILEIDDLQLLFNENMQMSPLHLALYLKNNKISKYLIQYGANLKDLAFDKDKKIKISVYSIAIITKNYKILQHLLPIQLLEDESLNIFQLACLRIDLKVVDFLLKDDQIYNKIIFDDQLTQELSKPVEIQQIIKNHRDSRESQQYLVQILGQETTKEVSIFTGEIFKLSNIFSRLTKRFIELNMITNTLTRYKKQSHYPLMPNGLSIRLEDIKQIRQYSPYWFKKKDKFYFEIVTDMEKQVYFTEFESTMCKWICSILYAQKNSRQNKLNRYNYVKSFEIIDSPGIFVDLPNNVKIDFEDEWGLNYNEIISQEINLLSTIEYEQKIQNILGEQLVTFNSFEIIKEIGRGAFGYVYLVQKKDDGQLLALKTQLKKNLILKKKLHYIVAEAEIMKILDHPFIMKMMYIFQTPMYIYFAMEYCPGIDLLKQLTQYRKFTQEQAKFYICELVLAIQYLHQKDIIYRDLKPENILIDKDGHIKLTDFGISKQNISGKQQSTSILGTPAYISPEMLNKQGASASSDIYGIGGIFYELLVGEPPFLDYDLGNMYEKIKEGYLSFPKHVSQEAQDLISQMMHIDPTQRIGYDDYNDILNHKFFESVNWSNVLNKLYIPPIVPQNNNIRKSNQKTFIDFDYNEKNGELNRIENLTFIYDSPVNL